MLFDRFSALQVADWCFGGCALRRAAWRVCLRLQSGGAGRAGDLPAWLVTNKEKVMRIHPSSLSFSLPFTHFPLFLLPSLPSSFISSCFPLCLHIVIPPFRCSAPTKLISTSISFLFSTLPSSCARGEQCSASGSRLLQRHGNFFCPCFAPSINTPPFSLTCAMSGVKVLPLLCEVRSYLLPLPPCFLPSGSPPLTPLREA